MGLVKPNGSAPPRCKQVIGFDPRAIAATHSPLLLASIEPFFDAATDAWFDLDLVKNGSGSKVTFTRRAFLRRGSLWANG